MAMIYVVQHAEKVRAAGDPGLTGLGRSQALETASWLRTRDLTAIYTSPLRRALETARPIADATGLPVTVDDRLRERMNWDGTQPIGEFLADWDRATGDRDFVPASGDSSRRAGERFVSFLAEHAHDAGPIAVVSHGGVTVDMLRTLTGDDLVPAVRFTEGMPSGGITTLDGLTVVEIAGTGHLSPV